MGVKLDQSHHGKSIGWRCWRIGCWGRYLGLLGRKWQQSGENCIWGAVWCVPHAIYYWDEQTVGMRWAGRMAYMREQHIPGFDGKTWRKDHLEDLGTDGKMV